MYFLLVHCNHGEELMHGSWWSRVSSRVSGAITHCKVLGSGTLASVDRAKDELYAARTLTGGS